MDDLAKAVEILKKGGLVAFPTETVYGLGADATSASAVQRIFTAKGRPSTNPLIVHVADESVARRYARHWPEAAGKLSRRFWPGPLTLVVPKTDAIVPEATAGLDTVGLRSPDHPLTLELLRRFNGPVAAPSANRSTRVSPTTSQHVHEELGDAVDYILDGGPCRVGIESTVLDLSETLPRILRPGALTKEQIEAEIGTVQLWQGKADQSTPAPSPGQQPVHYAPRAEAYRFDREELTQVAAWCREHANVSWAVLAMESEQLNRGMADLLPLLSDQHRLILMPDDAEEYGRRLYATLRALDDQGVSVLWVQLPSDTPQWLAVRDRLTRATQPANAKMSC